MDEEAAPPTLPRGAIRIGLALGMIVLVRATALGSWEAGGGVAMLAVAGASSVTWRTRADPLRSERAAALAALAGIALAAGGLVRDASAAPAIGIVALALVAMPPGLRAPWRIASFVVPLAAFVAGSAWVASSTPVRIGQTGAAFALGALLANVAADDASWGVRILASIVGVGLAAALA